MPSGEAHPNAQGLIVPFCPILCYKILLNMEISSAQGCGEIFFNESTSECVKHSYKPKTKTQKIQ